ncbi:hypothetical protein ACFSJ3_07450 [Corallincola platygyrae]|uniref:Uncharacterized protein n=1 Tax=Corallincola platygyrae TaxID=1193278 RepID=A0ABW4XMU5_9GAMM
MRLSKKPLKAYECWINQYSWLSHHPLDKKRFFEFVDTYIRYGRRHVSGEELRDDIVCKYASYGDQQELIEESAYYGQLFDDLVSFAKATGRLRNA